MTAANQEWITNREAEKARMESERPEQERLRLVDRCERSAAIPFDPRTEVSADAKRITRPNVGDFRSRSGCVRHSLRDRLVTRDHHGGNLYEEITFARC
jgi:hypothetical protein